MKRTIKQKKSQKTILKKNNETEFQDVCMSWDQDFDPIVAKILLEFKTCFIKKCDANETFGKGFTNNPDYNLLSEQLKSNKTAKELYELIFNNERLIRLFTVFLLRPDVKVNFENFVESTRKTCSTTPNIYDEDTNTFLSFTDYFDALKFVVNKKNWIRRLVNYLIEIKINQVYNL